MKLHFSTLMTIIVAKSIYGKNLKSVQLVLKNINSSHKAIDKINQLKFIKNSSLVAKKLNLEFSTISFQEYEDVYPETIDNGLLNKNYRTTPDVLFLSGDAYNCFFVSNKSRYLLTALKLFYVWRKAVNYKSKNLYFYYNFISKKIKRNNLSVINVNKVNKLIYQISIHFHSEIIKKYSLEENCEYALIMPPNTKYSGESFTKRFLKEAQNIAHSEKLNLIIKPHPNDTYNYSKIGYVSEEVRTIPVEFFFTIKNIKKIIAVPSSALAHAEPCKLSVFVPKDKELYRRGFLDQSNFLQLIGINPQKI